MKKVIIGIILSLILTTTLSGCGAKSQNTADEENAETSANGTVELTNEQMTTIGVTVGQVETRQMAGTIQASGTLRLSPQNRAEVTSLVSGLTKKILVKEGDVVREGQTVALVENTEIVAIQKEYLVANRQATLARSSYQRQLSLKNEGAGVEKNLIQSKAELEIAQANEQGLRQQLQQIGISPRQVAQGRFTDAAPVRSPISGIVGEVMISTGSYLDNQTVLMNIYDNAAIHADLNVFESDIASIKIGQKVDLQLSDKSETRLVGKVSFVTAAMDKESKSASVHVDLNQKSGTKLLPNMFVSASIHCEQTECKAVPEEAIVMNAGRSYVFVQLSERRFRQSEVVTGISQQGYVQITFVDKKDEGKKIVAAKAFYLESMIADHGEED